MRMRRFPLFVGLLMGVLLSLDAGGAGKRRALPAGAMVLRREELPAEKAGPCLLSARRFGSGTGGFDPARRRPGDLVGVDLSRHRLRRPGGPARPSRPVGESRTV